MNWKIKELVFFDSYRITNGKSIFEEGYESKLVTYKEALDFGISKDDLDALSKDSNFILEPKKKELESVEIEVEEKPYTPPNNKEREALQKVAREQFKLQMMKDISFDLQVCLIEGWDHKEYISELSNILNHLKNQFQIKKFSNQLSFL